MRGSSSSDSSPRTRTRPRPRSGRRRTRISRPASPLSIAGQCLPDDETGAAGRDLPGDERRVAADAADEMRGAAVLEVPAEHVQPGHGRDAEALNELAVVVERVDVEPRVQA